MALPWNEESRRAPSQSWKYDQCWLLIVGDSIFDIQGGFKIED
jgi:hypothetical protein